MYQKLVLMDERPQSWNTLKRLHWSGWQEEVTRAKYLVIEALGGMPDMVRQRVDVTVTAHYDKRPHDSDNIPAKLYIDGLVAAGLLADDRRQYLRRVTTEAAIDRDRPRVEIEVIGV